MLGAEFLVGSLLEIGFQNIAGLAMGGHRSVRASITEVEAPVDLITIQSNHDAPCDGLIEF